MQPSLKLSLQSAISALEAVDWNFKRIGLLLRRHELGARSHNPHRIGTQGIVLAAIDVVFAMAIQALLDVIRSGLYRQWVLAERALVLRVGHALRRACTQGCARKVVHAARKWTCGL